MDIIANISRGIDTCRLFLKPGTHQVRGKPRFFIRPERVGDDELTQMHATDGAVIREHLSSQPLGKTVR